MEFRHRKGIFSNFLVLITTNIFFPGSKKNLILQTKPCLLAFLK